MVKHKTVFPAITICLTVPRYSRETTEAMAACNPLLDMKEEKFSSNHPGQQLQKVQNFISMVKHILHNRVMVVLGRLKNLGTGDRVGGY